MKCKHKNIKDIFPSKTSHNIGIKKVFLNKNDSDDNLTQYAYAKLRSGDNITSRKHESMNEYFFVHSGNGELITDQGIIMLKQGYFFYIPNGVVHQIKIKHKDGFIELIYFGIAQKLSID